MAKGQVKLYIDIVSPFGYLGYYLCRHSPVFQQCDVKFVPILLGGVMKACNNTPPLNIKNKREWIAKERQRWAEFFGIPICNEVPDGFPIPTLLPQRALAAVSLSFPDRLLDVADALFDAFWVKRNEGQITKPPGLLPVLTSVLGEANAQRVMDEANQAPAKQRLVADTEAAVAEGAFGLPYFVCTNTAGQTETFWGIDHLGQLLDFLGLEKPAKQRGWRAVL